MSSTKNNRSDARSGAPKISPQAVVLLVDDQPLMVETLRRMLTDEPDIAFHYCSDPRESVRKAAEIDATVIMHDMQTEIDGMNLARYFRSQPATQRMSIVVLSANEDAASKAQAFHDGANDYLVKMPNKLELVGRLLLHSRTYLARLEREDGADKLRNSLNQQQQVNALLKRLADRDEITGVANRQSFARLLDREWRRGARENAELSVVVIVINAFDEYAAQYGEQRAGECLAQIARAAEGALLRPGDILGRCSRAEFVAALPGTGRAGADIVVERVAAAVETLEIQHGASRSGLVTVSFGVATGMPNLEMTSSVLLQAAEKAARGED